MITVGDTIPSAKITIIHPQEQRTVDANAYCADKKIALFALPGAFTPACSEAHLPSYVVNYDALKQKGIDEVACLSVNDAFVMQAWQKAQNADNITMIADGGAALSKAMGLTLETGDFGGTRAMRYSMLVENGVVKQLNLEEGTEFKISGADTLLTQV